MKYIAFLVYFLIIATVGATETAKELTLTLRCASDRGPKPLVAVWLETEEGKFVQTLQRFGRRTKYFKTLSIWHKLAKKESSQQLDAVTSATIKWRKTAALTVPVKTESYDLSKGNYVIRIEARAEKKKNNQDFKIKTAEALKGGVFKDDGHIKEVTIAVE